MYRRVPPAPTTPDPLSVYRRLTPRDRLLCSWLAEHYLLSTDQIATALFSSAGTARMRLTILHRLGVLSRFTFAGPTGGARPYLYTLGPVGLHLHPTTYHDPTNPATTTSRSSLERTRRIAAGPRLAHLLAVNQFFVDLHAHARTHPDAGLDRWWSEQHATATFASAGIRPDGHGVWRVGADTVGFFVEVDLGSESLPRVVAKLRAYQRLTEFGPRYPVLLWLPGRRRETHLLNTLAGVPTAMPVATAVHGDNPAGPVWTLAEDPDRPRALHELPSDHGPNAATNPHRYLPPDTDVEP